MGIGDWGLGIGDWAQSPNPQSPIPNPHVILFKNKFLIIKIIYKFFINKFYNYKNKFIKIIQIIF